MQKQYKEKQTQFNEFLTNKKIKILEEYDYVNISKISSEHVLNYFDKMKFDIKS
jgi:hypothetical protein